VGGYRLLRDAAAGAENDVRTGGKFLSRMEAKDGSTGFDFGGTYTEIVPMQKIAYTISDGRNVSVEFIEIEDSVKITEAFEMENENSEELQRAGWHTPTAMNDLREGGTFTSRMEAKDGSMGFDFAGTYTKVTPHALIEYVMGDGRAVSIAFEDQGGATQVTETFDVEHENPVEMQREGWQSILNTFKQYTEAHVRVL
jgi:uncharacterized protein YndB with AHSA1/START domain